MGLPVERVLGRDPFPSCRFFSRTVGGTLGHGALATTAADADTVDNVSLLGLVSQTAGLVGARRARGAVDDVQLAELY